MAVRNEDEKRNMQWRLVMTISSIVIILVAAFFLVKLFTSNPLEGKWAHQDSNLTMNVRSNDTVSVNWPEEFDEADVTFSMNYDVDMETKTFSVHADEEAAQKAAEKADETVAAEDVVSAMEKLEGTYDYNIELNVLTLTDREYGDQMMFDKQ